MHPLMIWLGHDPARRSKSEANVRYWHQADQLRARYERQQLTHSGPFRAWRLLMQINVVANVVL